MYLLGFGEIQNLSTEKAVIIFFRLKYIEQENNLADVTYTFFFNPYFTFVLCAIIAFHITPI